MRPFTSTLLLLVSAALMVAAAPVPNDQAARVDATPKDADLVAPEDYLGGFF
ncbi:hypothetical protein MMC16_007073 [Acarospora aff. strigata]|nr:hypothetical protein [Acarospora aff. strigata]